MKRRYLLAAAAWSGLIWLLSAQPPDAAYMPWLPMNLDKLAHLVVFAVLGLLLARGLGGGKWAVAAAVVLAALYGAGDEWHQAYVPGRDASPWDWVADLTGALAGALAARRALLPGRRGNTPPALPGT